MSVRSHAYLVSDRGNDWKFYQPPLKDGDDTDKGEYPQYEHPQTEYPRAQKDRHDHDRHLPDENHKALLAVREDKGIIFFEDQRDDAEDGKVR